VAAQAGIVAGWDRHGLLWLLLGICYGASNLSYALLQRRYPLELAGRVNTTLNLGAFAGAFFIQWGYGLAIDALLAGGTPAAAAHRLVMGALTALMAAGWAWYAINIRRLTS